MPPFPETEPFAEDHLIAAWEHYRDDAQSRWVVRVRWSSGIVQTAYFTDEELDELGALHRVRALLP